MKLLHIAFSLVAAIFIAWPALACHAAPIDPAGQWYQVPASQQAADINAAEVDLSTLAAIPMPVITGGSFLFEGSFDISEDGRYVIDFKNSSTLAHFKHSVFNDKGVLLASLQGGIMNPAVNPYFLRHGRALALPAGHYRLVTELASPYFIAPPQPYINSEDSYQQSIKLTNALTLVSLGIFIALGIYYSALAGLRMHIAEGMYAGFILGNLIFNAAGLLVLSDLFGYHHFYLTSTPILFSNLAYVVFVMHLLGITPSTNPKLFYSGLTALGLMLIFIVLTYFHINWSLEFARYGVGIFLCYGLVAGISLSLQGNRSARLYIIAILTFFAMGGLTITSKGLLGEYTFYIEHMGLVSVATETILLALVLSYQFAQLHRDKEYALFKLRQSERIAMTDALTGLPNRYALDQQLERLPPEECLTFLDLDSLKYYNDKYGHERGDVLLQEFSSILRKHLGSHATAHRLGGDEFAVTCASGQQDFINKMLAHTVIELKSKGFEFAGFSAGSVYVHEGSNKAELMNMADTRMYDDKRLRKSRSNSSSLDVLTGF